MAEYAYVTDGACTEREIIAMEVIICKVSFVLDISGRPKCLNEKLVFLNEKLGP